MESQKWYDGHQIKFILMYDQIILIKRLRPYIHWTEFNPMPIELLLAIQILST